MRDSSNGSPRRRTTPLVSVEGLAARLREPRVVVVDARWALGDPGAGRRAWENARLPGAVFVDVETELSGPPARGPGRHPLPSTDDFAAAMERAGVGDDSFVVAYDDVREGDPGAARLWWLLRHYGHDAAAVLDGGFGAWVDAGRPVEAGVASARPAARAAARFTPRAARADVVARAAVSRLAHSGTALLVDARTADRYRGDAEPIDARAGHIPGAVNVPWHEHLAADGRLLPPAALRARYAAAGAARGTSVVAYCGSGVTACVNLHALAVAGFDDAFLYEGSWSDWSRDLSLPAATAER